MKVLIAGYSLNCEQTFDLLDSVDFKTRIDCIVASRNEGVGPHALKWAQYKDIPYVMFPTGKFSYYGRSASHTRNKKILDDNSDIDLLVVAYGGKSIENLTHQVRERGIEIFAPLT